MTIHFKLFKNILQYVHKFNNILLILCFFSIKIFDNTKEILIKFLLRMEFALSAKLVYLLECEVDKNVIRQTQINVKFFIFFFYNCKCIKWRSIH